ncbi:hypothetical protein A2U01_0016676, partial [Trifolium medium]|nr:hypothetical protein [Trifolium medium]
FVLFSAGVFLGYLGSALCFILLVSCRCRGYFLHSFQVGMLRNCLCGYGVGSYLAAV